MAPTKLDLRIARGAALAAAALAAALVAAGGVNALPLSEGDVLLLRGPSLAAVDLDTGEEWIVSGAGVGSGPELEYLGGVTIDASGDIIATDMLAGRILRIDPQTGDRSVIASSSVGGGDFIQDPGGIDIDPEGNLYYIEAYHGGIVQLDPATGDRQTVSGRYENDAGSGIVGEGTTAFLGYLLNQSLSAGPNGILWLVGYTDGQSDHGVISVNPTNGRRRVRASEGDGNGPDIAFAADVNADVLDTIFAVSSISPAIFAIDRQSGEREVVYPGIFGTEFHHLDLDSNGDLIFLIHPRTGDTSPLRGLHRLDLETGTRTQLTDEGLGISDIVVYKIPTIVPEPRAALLVAMALAGIALRRRA